jgi:hypothetical protein
MAAAAILDFEKITPFLNYSIKGAVQPIYRCSRSEATAKAKMGGATLLITSLGMACKARWLFMTITQITDQYANLLNQAAIGWNLFVWLQDFKLNK